MSEKDYLNRAFDLHREIKLKKMELKNLRESAEKINSSNFESERINGGKTNDCLSEIISRIVDFEKEIKDDELKYLKITNNIKNTISHVDDLLLKLILQKRHLDFMSMEQIAEHIHYSRTDTYRKYNAALKQIKKMVHNGIVWYSDM